MFSHVPDDAYLLALGWCDDKDKAHARQLDRRLKQLGDEGFVWREALIQQLHLTEDVLSEFQGDYKKLYQKLYRFTKCEREIMLPKHTEDFMQNMGINNALILQLASDDLPIVMQHIDNLAASGGHDELKEIQILAALFGAKQISNYLRTSCNLLVDKEVMEASILSGDLAHAESFMEDCRPTSSALIAGIKSRELEMVSTLVNKYQLQPGRSLFPVIASTGDMNMFAYFIKQKIKPDPNDFTMQMAVKAGSAELAMHLRKVYGYQVTPDLLAMANKYDHTDLAKSLSGELDSSSTRPRSPRI